MEYDNNDPEERFKFQIARTVIVHLNSVHELLNIVNTPISAEGKLVKRSDGRYEIVGTNKYFTSGSTIEVWNDKYDEWDLTRVEHIGAGETGDYYIVSLGKDKKNEGLTVRVRVK